MVGGLVGLLIGLSVGRSVGLVAWLIGRLFGWFVGWSVGRSVGWFVGLLTGRQVGCNDGGSMLVTLSLTSDNRIQPSVWRLVCWFVDGDHDHRADDSKNNDDNDDTPGQFSCRHWLNNEPR